MTTIEIKNAGPVKEAVFDLNRVNVFMGAQSSGKSTIAKIISYCTWVEKDVATAQSLDDYRKNKNLFRERLETYHKMKGYFGAGSAISYKSDVVEFNSKDNDFSIEWVDRYAYQRSKISYIPSERNMIVLPEMRKVELSNNSIRSFLFDWFTARKNYPKAEGMSILGLGVDYYYSESSDEDHIVNAPNGQKSYDILLSNASSGLQSLTPLVCMVEYLTDRIYRQEGQVSFELNEKRKRAEVLLWSDLVYKPYTQVETPAIEEVRKGIEVPITEVREAGERMVPFIKNFQKIQNALFSTHHSQFIIEEPEQNLFPETQRDLVYYLLKKCLDKTKAHRLTITTHSPYILYALNNCMLSGLVFDKMVQEDKDSLGCQSSLINPKEVSIYQMDNGILKQIQQEDGLIGSNYFDEKMKEIMDDFYLQLKYYDDEG
jgi:predicted ATPase